MQTELGSVHFLSKRQKNILYDIARDVALYADGSLQKVETTALRQLLDSYRYTCSEDTIGVVNTLRPQLLTAILGATKNARKQQYIKGVSSMLDVLNIIDALTCAIVNNKPIVFRMVYGATTEASLRSIGYPLPAMLMIKQIKAMSGVDVYLKIIFANTISGTLNAFPCEQVASQCGKIRAGISRLAHQLEVSEQVGFYDDNSVDFERIAGLAGLLKKSLSGSTLDLLVQKGHNREQEASLHYMAAHVLLHDTNDIALRRLAGANIPSDTASYVDIGGVQESFFVEARDKLLEVQNKTRPPFIFTRNTVPPYYLAKNGDVSINYLSQAPLRVEAISLSRAVLLDLVHMQPYFKSDFLIV